MKRVRAALDALGADDERPRRRARSASRAAAVARVACAGVDEQDRVAGGERGEVAGDRRRRAQARRRADARSCRVARQRRHALARRGPRATTARPAAAAALASARPQAPAPATPIVANLLTSPLRVASPPVETIAAASAQPPRARASSQTGRNALTRSGTRRRPGRRREGSGDANRHFDGRLRRSWPFSSS